MNKEYFTDNINVEKMAALIDKTIKFEKNNKKDRFKNMNIIYKIVPAVAAVALIFGAVNLPIFKNFNNFDKPESTVYISTTEIKAGDLIASTEITEVSEKSETTIEVDFNDIVDALPLMKQSAVDEFVKKEYDQNGLKNLPDYVWIYMSQKAVGEIAVKEYDKNGLKNLQDGDFEYIWIYMNKSSVDTIAKKEFDKNGFKNFHDMLYIYMSDELICELVTDESSEYWNKYAWTKQYDKNHKTQIFTLKDGTIIETTGQYSTYADLMTKNSEKEMYGFMQPVKSITIKLANGITITAPGGSTVKATPVKDADHKVEITIGSGSATIIKPDGTTSTLSKGTVLDGKGNIVK